MLTNPIDLQAFKDWFTVIVTAVATIVGIILWIQSINDPKFLEIEKEMQLLRQEVVKIRDNNNEILRIVGRLEGKLEK